VRRTAAVRGCGEEGGRIDREADEASGGGGAAHDGAS
jgi:hypothetical protein